MRNSGARLSNQPHRRPPVSPSPFQKKNPQRDRSTSALVSTAAHPPAPRLPQTLNIQHLTLCLCSWVQTQQISKPKTFFFFMLYIRFVCSEHPAAGRSGTVSTADIEGSVGNWIEDIGQWPPTY